MILSLLLAAVLSADPVVVDNLPAGQSDASRSYFGTWTDSTQAGYYGVKSVVSSTAGSAYTFTVPASGAFEVLTRWTGSTNRSSAVPVTILDGVSQVGSAVLDETKSGATWTSLGTFTFSGSAVVVFTVPSGGKYASVDGIRLVPAVAEDPPPDDPPDDPPATVLEIKATEHLYAWWSPVTTGTRGGEIVPCTVDYYELVAVAGISALSGEDVPPDGSRFLQVSPDQPFATGIEVTDQIRATVKTSWKLYVRAWAGLQVSDWSDPFAVTYDPGQPLPIVPAKVQGFKLRIEITVGQ